MKIELSAFVEGDNSDTKQTVNALLVDVVGRMLRQIERELEGDGHDVDILLSSNAAELADLRGNLK